MASLGQQEPHTQQAGGYEKGTPPFTTSAAIFNSVLCIYADSGFYNFISHILGRGRDMLGGPSPDPPITR